MNFAEYLKEIRSAQSDLGDTVAKAHERFRERLTEANKKFFEESSEELASDEPRRTFASRYE